MRRTILQRFSDLSVPTMLARRLYVALPVGIVLIATLIVSSYVQRAEQARLAVEVEGQTRTFFNRLRQNFDVYLGVVQSIGSFYEASDSVKREEFRTFVADAQSRHDGVQALEWIPCVPHEQRATYERAAQVDGLLNFQFKKWTPDAEISWSGLNEKWAEEYFPVYFVEPVDGNEKAMGIDLGSNPTRLAAIQHSRETGQAVATARITLAQETGKQAGFLIFHPVFSPHDPGESTKDRTKHLRGFALGVFRVGDIVDAVLEEWDIGEIELRITDMTGEGNQRSMFGTEQLSENENADLQTKFTYNIGGRRWQCQFTPTPQYIAARRGRQSQFVLLGGLFVALLVGVIFEMLNGRAAKIEGVVSHRTEQLNRSNATLAQTAEELIDNKAQLEELHKELRKDAIEADAASHAKSEFLANMSHELRTPLNSMLILAKVLEDNAEGNLTTSQIEMAGVIHSGGQELLTLINDLLDLAKVEAGKLEPFFDPVRLRPFVDSLHTQIAAQAERKGLTLETRIEDGLPETLTTDGRRVAQVLRNLLSNAIKFTNAGSVTLRVGLPEAHTHFTNANLTPNNSLAFTVTDTGIGIAATDQTAIFESFRQVDGSISRQYGGTGLGLSICREFAKLLGGEVFLKSQQGVGSTFTLCLPLEPVFEATPEVGSGQESDWSSSTDSRQSDDESLLALDKRMVGKKVLVVDDDMRNLFAMSQVLETSGMSVVSAENGQVALKLLEREDAVDIIVMDIMMPVMDGYQAIRAIRDQPRFKNMPIVALTAQAMPDDRDKCLDAGANEYLTKPIEAAELLSRMSGLLFETEPIHGHSSEDHSKFAGNAAKLEAE